jgi:hypothetical protein
MRSHPARRKLFAAPPTAFHPRPRRAATLNFRTHPSMLGMVGARVRAAGGPLRAYREVRAHIPPRELNATTPTALHLRPSWAPDEIECRVLLKLPYTNRVPALATSLRHTNDSRKAEPDGSAAQHQRPRRSTNRPACERCQPYGRRHRTARVCPTSSSTIPFHGQFVPESPHFPRAGVPQHQSPGSPRGMGPGDLIWRRFRARPRRPPSPISNPLGTYVRRWRVGGANSGRGAGRQIATYSSKL